MNLSIPEMTMDVTNINPSTENHGDEIKMATDISLRANMAVDILSKFSDNDKDWASTWKKLLWNKDGEITGHCLDSFEFKHEFKEHTFRIADEDGNLMEFNDTKISKFVARPVPGHRIELTFQARVHPNKKQNGELTALQKTETTVEILESPQGDMLQEGE